MFGRPGGRRATPAAVEQVFCRAQAPDRSLYPFRPLGLERRKGLCPKRHTAKESPSDVPEGLFWVGETAAL